MLNLHPVHKAVRGHFDPDRHRPLHLGTRAGIAAAVGLGDLRHNARDPISHLRRCGLHSALRMGLGLPDGQEDNTEADPQGERAKFHSCSTYAQVICSTGAGWNAAYKGVRQTGLVHSIPA